MRLLIERLQLRKDFDTLNFLKRSLAGLGLAGLIIEIFLGYSGWGILIVFPALYFLYRMLHQTFERFYYSYWVFNIMLFSYILWSLYKSLLVYGNSILSYVYTLMLFANGIKTYIISSPIYFPIVNWWEYDFRYRRDIPILIKSGSSDFEGRIIDFRREAAGIQSFQKFEPGDSVEIHFNEELEGPNLKGDIYSVRKYSFGRPYVLGVKFDLRGSEGRYQQVLKFWQEQNIGLKKLRIKKESV